MKISRITCYEVVVPALKGAIDSKQVSKPLHKLPVGAMGGWSLQFDKLPKLLIKMELECGIIGWGELYRNHNWATVDAIIHTLLGVDIESLSLQKLPFTFCREYDGFECAVWDAYAKLHNMRVVDLLEAPYPNFPGLNLTFEVREGLQKHQAFYDPPEAEGEKYRCPSLEAQIANLADEITYYSHDLDDAVDFEILSAEQLEETAVWRQSHARVAERYPETREPEQYKLIISNIIDVQVGDVISSSARAIAAAGVKTPDEVRRQERPLICYSDELLEANRELRRFLYKNVYYHPRVAEVNRQACEMLRAVFEAYVQAPERLGDQATKRIEAEGLHRTVCDYIAGMTDRYLLEEHARLAERRD